MLPLVDVVPAQNQNAPHIPRRLRSRRCLGGACCIHSKESKLTSTLSISPNLKLPFHSLVILGLVIEHSNPIGGIMSNLLWRNSLRVPLAIITVWLHLNASTIPPVAVTGTSAPRVIMMELMEAADKQTGCPVCKPSCHHCCLDLD